MSNVLPEGTSDAAWLRACHAVVPRVVAAFRPEVLVTQHGADSHREDPLADLKLTIDGHRTSYLALRVFVGTGGAAGLDAPAGYRRRTGYRPVGLAAQDWIAMAATTRPDVPLVMDMTEGTTGLVSYERWDGTVDMALGRAIQDTRNRIYPLHGLDPHDRRD